MANYEGNAGLNKRKNLEKTSQIQMLICPLQYFRK